ncbi:MAG: ABC transporter substrate-binding protein [Aggregatilineales bacterium]
MTATANNIVSHSNQAGKIKMSIRKAAKTLLVVFAVTALNACLPEGNAFRSASSQNRLIYGLTLEPSGFDPHIHRSSELGIPLRQVYDTLVYRDPNTKAFVPGLATEWSISSDGLMYTFKLREGVTFHDGTAFNAQAVAANLDRIVDPATGSQRAVFMLGPYAGYEIVDDYTIRIVLERPYAALLDALSQVYLGIASPSALNAYSTARYQFHQVGTGPFTFVELVPGQRILLRRNNAYMWGPSFYKPVGENSVEEIEFRFYTDPSTRALALESGEAHVMGEILPTDARLLTGNSAIQLLPVSVPGQPTQFLINTTRFPTDNRAVRQALLFGTNRNAIIDAIFQRFSPVAWGPLAANTLYYDRALNGSYSYDIAQAQALLTSVGFADSNADGILDINGFDLEVNVVVPPWGLIPQIAELLQDQWRIIGVRALLTPVPTFPALQQVVESGAYNLVAFDTAGLDPVFLNDFFLSTGSLNWTGFANQELDTVLTQAATVTDEPTRQALYARAQQIIMEEALLLPIRDYVNLNASRAQVQQLTFDPYGWFPLLNNVVMLGTES